MKRYVHIHDPGPLDDLLSIMVGVDPSGIWKAMIDLIPKEIRNGGESGSQLESLRFGVTGSTHELGPMRDVCYVLRHYCNVLDPFIGSQRGKVNPAMVRQLISHRYELYDRLVELSKLVWHDGERREFQLPPAVLEFDDNVAALRESAAAIAGTFLRYGKDLHDCAASLESAAERSAQRALAKDYERLGNHWKEFATGRGEYTHVVLGLDLAQTLKRFNQYLDALQRLPDGPARVAARDEAFALRDVIETYRSKATL